VKPTGPTRAPGGGHGQAQTQTDTDTDTDTDADTGRRRQTPARAQKPPGRNDCDRLQHPLNRNRQKQDALQQHSHRTATAILTRHRPQLRVRCTAKAWTDTARARARAQRTGTGNRTDGYRQPHSEPDGTRRKPTTVGGHDGERDPRLHLTQSVRRLCLPGREHAARVLRDNALVDT